MSNASDIDVENLSLESYFENLDVPRDYFPPSDVFHNLPALPVPTPPQTIRPSSRRSSSEGYSSGSSSPAAARNRSRSPAAARNRSPAARKISSCCPKSIKISSCCPKSFKVSSFCQTFSKACCQERKVCKSSKAYWQKR
ncbi:hypothetical protein TNCV_4570571 [Trichonephila clavipes]|nr:hypothetical protein TNCV_4570571 [Trichonephila clavipes]